MNPIRVGIIGQGRSGRDIHGEYLCRDTRRFRIVAAVDPIAERRERAAREYGCEVFPTHEPLLARRDIDLIVNASPTRFHVPYTREFLRAGFHVLCEKPAANRARDVDLLIASAKKAGKVYAIFQQSRFAPYFRKVRQVIDSGVLGDIVQISIAANGFLRRYDWQTLTEEQGGSLLNTGPHPLDQALQIFGTDVMPRVTCFMRRATTYGDAEDHVVLILSGDNRPLINLEISSCCAYPAFLYHVYGTRGGMKGSSTDVEWRYYNPAKAPALRLHREPISKPNGTPSYCTDTLRWICRAWKVPPSKSQLFDSMSADFYRMLHRTLTAGAPLAVTPGHVRQQIAVIEECRRQNPEIYGKR